MADYKGLLQLSEDDSSYLLLCEEKLKTLKVIDIALFNESPIEKCVEYINTFLTSKGISNDDFSLSITLPTGRFSHKYLTLPPLKGKKLEEMVKFEWIRSSPFNEEDVEIKFVPDFKKEKTLVSAFLLQKKFIEKITSPFLERRIYIQSIVPEPFAVFSIFSSFPLLLVGFHKKNSSLFVIGEKGIALWVFSMSEEGMIKSLLRSYRAKWGELPDVVFVYGDGDSFSKLLEESGLKSIPYTQPDYIEFEPPLTSEEQIKIIPAIGLAGILINGIEHPEFSRTEFISPVKMRNIKSIYLSLGAAGILFLTLFTLSSLLQFFHYKREYLRTSSEVVEVFKKSFPDVEKIVDPVTQMKEKLNLLRARGKRGEGKVIDFIRDLKQDISSVGNVRITEMILEGEKIRLKGQTGNISLIDACEKKLRERHFKDVRLMKTQKSLKEEIYEFEITIEQ